MRPPPRLSAVVLALAFAAAPSVVRAKDPPKATAAARAEGARERASGKKKDGTKEAKDATKESKNGKKGRSPRAKSSGAPNHGTLEGAVRLRKSPHIALREGAHTWAMPELVRALRSAADEVASKHKGSVLFVGDLSAKGGGPLSGHNSHQSGRDVDVGFFVQNSKGKPVNTKRFMAFTAEGRAQGGDWGHFDDARNWAFVEALIKEERAGVRYIFVSRDLRARLLKFAAKKHASDELVTRAASVLMTPEHVEAHDDHFHVRLTCPTSSKECVEESLGSAGPDDPYAEDVRATKAPAATTTDAPRDPAASE